MKAIILAAGEGKRLRPYTEDRPKCMVAYRGRPVIDYILDVMQGCGVDDISVVCGYKAGRLQDYLSDCNVRFYENRRYDSTNMVTTLFCAENEMTDDDIIISYADIIYNSSILNKLIRSDAGISVAVDKNWLNLWQLRAEDPLLDAETMKMDSDGNVIELGKKPRDLREIEGQYMGIIKIRASSLKTVREFYAGLDRKAIYDGKDFDNMYMTSFVQQIIDRLMSVKAVINDDKWIEIDSVDDLKKYESVNYY